MSRPRLAAGCFVLGALLVLLLDIGVARIIGVPLMLAGLFVGVAAIATPEFLAGDREERE